MALFFLERKKKKRKRKTESDTEKIGGSVEDKKTKGF